MKSMNVFMAVVASALCLQMLGGHPAIAKSETKINGGDKAKGKTTTTATTDSAPNSDTNYLYDRMMWDHAVPAWSHENLTNNDSPDYCLPRNTNVIGQSATLTTVTNFDGSDGAGDKPATSEAKYLPVIVNPNHILGNLFGDKNLEDANKAITASKNPGGVTPCEGVNNPKNIAEGAVIYLDPTNALRWGWEYGALLVPFKMQLGGKHAFSGAASAGAYLGYRVPIGDTGIVLSPVAFAGASSIAVPADSGKAGNNQTMAGLSYGLGVIGRVKDGFQVGVIFGKDHVDSKNYIYNDKTWVSFEIGYSFAQ